MHVGIFFRTMFLCAALIVSAVFAGAPVEAREIAVPRDFSSIQAAIDAAAPGDSIVVSKGAYKGSVVIAKPVTLRSEHGREGTIIASAKFGENAVSVVGVFSGVQAGATGGAVGATITGFTISAPGASAVLVRDSSGVAVVANRLTGGVNGLLSERSSGLRVGENVADFNEKGIYFYYTDSSIVERNNADSNVNNGILLHASHGNKIIANTTNSNEWNGITLSASNNNEIRDNRAVKNTYAIVIGESAGNELSGNVERRRLFWLLPVALIYAAIMLYLIERKAFQFYYRIKYGERG